MPEKLLTIEEAAGFLGISEAEIRNLVKKGDLPAYQIDGKYLRFRREQLEVIQNEMPAKPLSRQEAAKAARETQNARVASASYHESVSDRLADFLYFNDFYLVTGAIIALLVWIILGSVAFADTLFLKNGGTVMGIVVEEYQDRVVISTYEGEKNVFKRNIERIAYDLPEQNLVKMGDSYVSRREYEKAYFYYEKATKENPEYKTARDKMNYVMGYLFRRREQEKLADIIRRQEFETWPAPPPEERKDHRAELENRLGIRISPEGSKIRIDNVTKNSPADFAGLSKGDSLIAVWGKFTGYMGEKDAAELLLEESAGETKISIERDVVFEKEPPLEKPYMSLFGGKLDMLMDGLTITEVFPGGPAEEAGLCKDDLVTAIDGRSTRYMPLKEAVKIIKDRQNDTISFTVQREVTMWRKK